MKSTMTRRHAVTAVVAAGTNTLLGKVHSFAAAPLQVAGVPVEISLTPVTPETVRITIQSIQNGNAIPVPSDGALAHESWGRPAARFQTVSGSKRVKCGALQVEIQAEPLSFRVTKNGV